MAAYVWLVVLTLIFVVMLVYNVFTSPLSQVEISTKEYINETLNQTNSTIAERAYSTINLAAIVWQYWPLLLIFGLLLWAYVATQRREPLYEGY